MVAAWHNLSISSIRIRQPAINQLIYIMGKPLSTIWSEAQLLIYDVSKVNISSFLMKFIPNMYQGVPISHAKFQSKRSWDCGEIEH